ncbi:MAG TPA: hypothetical protein DCS38_03765, partial [Ruminococcus sp.]|nr:hypothetical protein [Ruminococcus sp.]
MHDRLTLNRMKGCNKMKKYLFLLISCSLCLSAFSGCNTVDNSENKAVNADVTSSVSEETETAAESSEIQYQTEAGISENITESSAADTDIYAETSVQTLDTQAQASAEKIVLSQDTMTVLLNETAAAEASVTPSGTSAVLVWSSTDSTIASVDADGNIKGISEGACTIMVKDKNNPDVSASIHVTVRAVAETTQSNSVNGVTALTYVSGILVVNKTYALPSDYDPGVDAD